MDKILAFSILSSSPADISATAFSTRLSWRASAGSGSHSQKQRQQQEKKAPIRQQEEKKATDQQGRNPETTRARFAPEFDGINCFESIVSYF
ncbi:hypothetical protein HU200_003947 [Digitaria exilis]|uniref:Uncharacterized protein n=1 Tax=Digitaria exilis TaxID=1010633 RepID=A0A835FX21_9POAL|nr:hypothetical protein HU200_015102 [Digitaria exilis]KAF8776040.1 hypothetical protein HU200_003947 [Digitaria exilis]CAB3469371.1 unnamed protein product [Digitaria exilis]